MQTLINFNEKYDANGKEIAKAIHASIRPMHCEKCGKQFYSDGTRKVCEEHEEK